MTARRRLTTDNTYRSCSRCGQELTDPASRERGVGPVCRNKDNHLYAKLIKANIPVAGVHLMQLRSEELPKEIQGRFDKFKQNLVERFAQIQTEVEDPTQMVVTGSDFREEVRELDYFLSYNVGVNYRQAMVGMVRALGYVGLAAVLSGEASKSKAKIWFENGRVFLQGTGCTPGWRKMKKIPGIKTPKYRGDKNPYSAPAVFAAAFFDVVIEHWPLYDAEIDALKAQAEAWAKDNPEAVQAEEELPTGPTATISKRTEDFILQFPWDNNKDMRGMIAKLKKIPSKERSFDPVSKNWLFRLKHLDTIKAVAEEYYDTVFVGTLNEDTPKDKWVKKNPYPKRSRRGRSRRYHPGYNLGYSRY